MLKKVKKLNFDTYPGGYAPATEPAVINLDHVVSVSVAETRRHTSCVLVRLVDGSHIHCVGVPDDFLEPQPNPPAADAYFGEPFKEEDS